MEDGEFVCGVLAKGAEAMTRKYRRFKSPIEVMLRNGIVTAAASHNVHLFDHSINPGRAQFHLSGGKHQEVAGVEDWCDEWGDGCEDLWSLFGEVQVAQYRVDLLMQPRGGWVAIECDGHEYHDRTKQQAAYDRARDRDLLKLGITTIRFTGSEIHHSVDRCVADVYDISRLVQDREDTVLHAWRAGHEAGKAATDRMWSTVVREHAEKRRQMIHPEEHW